MNIYRIVVREIQGVSRTFLVHAPTIERAMDKAQFEFNKNLELFGTPADTEVLLAEKLEGKVLR